MAYGSIVRIEAAHGFGFIRDDAGMDWLFVPSGVRGGGFEQVWVGARVGFVPEATPRGPRATDVHPEQTD